MALGILTNSATGSVVGGPLPDGRGSECVISDRVGYKSLLHYRGMDAELLQHSMSPLLADSARTGASSNDLCTHVPSLADLPMKATVSEL